MSTVLRDYQEQFVAEISAAFRTHRRVVGVAPTGSGKTVMFCEMIRRASSRHKRILVVAHRIEIVQQIGRALKSAGVDFGLVLPGIGASHDTVKCGMVQTVSRRIGSLPAPDLIVVDEAHHIIAPTYGAMLGAWPEAFVLGVTATPQRTDGQGLGAVFGAMVLGPSMRQLIAAGHLASYRYLAPAQQIDLSGVRQRGGDYQSEALEHVMDRRAVTGDAIEHYRTHLAGAPAIAFCATVAHANHVAQQFAEAGYRAASVDGKTDPAERAALIAGIGDGRLQVLASCDLISEGTDIPAVAGAILLRPTASLIIAMQQCGRVLRPKPDGSRAVILDHVGNVHRHGLPDEDREWSLDGHARRDKRAAITTCPECYAVFSRTPVCPECGHDLRDNEGGGRSAPEAVDGSLAEFTHEDAAARRWRDEPYSKCLKRAKTPELLREMAAARGYKPAWVRKVLAERGAAHEAYRTGARTGARA